MKLEEFKKGDLIHRTQPIRRERASVMYLSNPIYEDYSFVEEIIELVDIKSGLLFYKNYGSDELKNTAFARFDDEYWDYYPKEYLKETEEDLS